MPGARASRSAYLAIPFCLALAALQCFASVALRDRARPGSWPALVPDVAVARFDDVARALPLPLPLRVAFARAVLDLGDLRRADADARRLPDSAERAALYAALARARGDLAGAARDDLRAGDPLAIAADANALLAASPNGAAPALALERAAVASLGTDPAANAQRARAEYDLGVMEQAVAVRSGVASPGKRGHALASLAAYQRASDAAPQAGGYLVALGNQALNVGDDARAERAFERALDLDPQRPEPHTGLGDVALRRGDVARARGELAIAQHLDPAAPAVRRLARELTR